MNIAEEFFSVVQPEKHVSVGHAFDEFLESLEQRRRSPRTIQTYRQRLQKFVLMYGDSDLNDLSPDHINDWMAKYISRDTRYEDHPLRPTEREQLSNVTIIGLVQSIKAFMNFCDHRFYDHVQWKRPPSSHLHRPPKPKKSSRKNGAMRIKDFKKLMKVVVYKRDKALLAFMADTAVRAGEALSLQISSINFENLTAEVNGKTGYRDVFFTQQTADLLQEWLVERPNVRHDFVFTSIFGNSFGQPLTYHGLYLVFRRLKAKAGIKGVCNAQSIRRMVGQMWADRGINPERIQLKLGHSDVKTTLDWYTFQDMDRVRETTELLSLLRN